MNSTDLFVINLFFVVCKEVLEKYKKNIKLTEREKFLCLFVIARTLPAFEKLYRATKEKRLVITR